MKEKLKKIAVAVFLTLLIWTWAYMALEQTISETGTLNVAPSSPDIYVQFDRDAPVRLKLKLKGSPSKVTEFRSKLFGRGDEAEKEKLDFYFNAEKEDMATPDTYKLNVLQFLEKDERLKGLGLTVESCDVETIEVAVEKLVEEWPTVQCVDERGEIVRHSSIKPPQVRMFVRPDWPKESLIATVKLTQLQIEQARKSSIIEKPYVEFSASKRRYADVNVEINLPSTEEPLSERPLQAKIGFLLSPNLQGKYRIELLNESELTSRTAIKASDSAWAEYKRTPYQILIEAQSGDETSGVVITREVFYNFPAESVRKKEIKLIDPPRRAKFKLVPIAAPQASP
ncbi:MAG: hypothetical protein KAJ07_05900 [Planctomycetes bacterium]|nr:hypothetical protein [Planctomycetota bacterium]